MYPNKPQFNYWGYRNNKNELLIKTKIMLTFLITLGIVYTILIVSAFIVGLSIKFDKDHFASRKSWHYKLYCFLRSRGTGIWISNTPKSVCSYFWTYFIAILLIPIQLPSLVLGLFKMKFNNYDDQEQFGVSILGWLYLFVLYLVGYNIVFDTDNDWVPFTDTFLNELYAFSAGFVIVNGGILIFVLLVLLSIKLFDKTKKYRRKCRRNRGLSPVRRESIISSRLKAWKDKSCPVIRWD